MPDENNDDLPSQNAYPLNAAGKPYDPATGRILPHANQPARQAPTQPIVQQPEHPQAAAQQAAPPEPLTPLQELAIKLGVPASVVPTISREQLEPIVHNLYQKQIDDQQQFAQRQPQFQRQPQVVPPPVDPDADLDDLGLTAESTAEEIIAVMKKIAAKVKTRAPREQLEQLTKAQQAAMVDAEFDRFFAQHPEVFGQGFVNTNSLEGLKRQSIKQQCYERVSQGRGTSPFADASAVFAMSGWGQAPMKPRISEEQWNAAGLAQPGARRTTANLSERERRIAEIEAHQRDNGVYVPHSAGPDNDDLPD